MTKPLPFTQAGLRRAILAAKSVGLHVVGIRPDGTVVTSETPLEQPTNGTQNAKRNKWAEAFGSTPTLPD